MCSDKKSLELGLDEIAPGLFDISLDKSFGIPFEDIVVLRSPKRVYSGKGKKRVFGDQYPVNIRDQISYVLETHLA